MEPCAPGTEDDVPMFTTKREQELQRLLRQKAIVRDGQYKQVFERSYLNGTEHWYCNACECAVMGRVFTHEVGKRHMFNMIDKRIPNRERNEDEKKEETVPVIEIAPGEPAPPGFEEEAVRQATLIQSSLDGFKAGPLLALEYLLELHDVDQSKEPFYLCVLCDKKGDPRTVMSHLSSYNHISCFLRRHFPKCWRKLAPYMQKSNKKEWQNTMQRVAEAIERQFGRLKPTACEKAMFNDEKERAVILEKIVKSKHFTELAGYTFEEYIVVEKLMSQNIVDPPTVKKSPSPPRVPAPNRRLKEAVTKPAAPLAKPVSPQKTTNIRKRNDSLSSVSSVSSDPGKPEKQTHQAARRLASPQRGRYQKPQREEVRFELRPKYGRYDRKLPYERRGSSPVKRRPSPRRQENPDSENDKVVEKKREELRKIQEFRKLSRAIENDLQRTLQKYEKNPEKHPQYNEEWKKFWNRRYKELQGQGVDVSKYDFKPEWIVFWNRRMVELHSDEVREKKEALRKRLAVPEEINTLKINIINPGAAKIGPNLPMTALADQESDVIVIDDDNESKERPQSPWEREKPSWNKDRAGSPWRRDGRRSPGRASPSRQPSTRSPRRSPARRGSPRLRSPVRRGSPRRSPLRRPSPKRSPLRRASPRRSPFSSRNYDRPRSRERSRSRNRSRSKSKNPPHSRNLSKDRSSYGRSRSRSRNPRSTSRDRFSDRRARETSFERDSKAKGKLGERRLHTRESSLDSDMKTKERDRRMLGRESSFDRDTMKDSLSERRLVRESSFERDLKAKERVRTVADLPWEREKAAAASAFRLAYDPYYDPAMKMRKPMILPEPVMPEEEDDNGEVNVVDVLRILTALEDKLGVLGTKVVDLLAQALAMEKKEANSSETLLDNELNCVLFETVKEKLKGQLQAGLVDAIQERAFKKAIKKIASLIHLAANRNNSKPKAPPKQNPLSVPGVGAVDKAAIAKQITTALIAQGKTDVTEAELEQLINAVVGMAEAKAKNAAKPVTTASFLEQLSGGDKSNDTKKTEVADLDKITEPLTPSPRRNSPNMDNLSDSDLKTLLQNFKDLSTDEQHNLINYLKKLELREPERVEKLRKFVNLEPGKYAIEGNSEEQTKTSGSRESPFLDRLGSVNPVSKDLISIESDEEMEDVEEEQQDKPEDKSEPEKPQKMHVDSDDEDYTFDDVVKSVSKNVKDKELQSNMEIIQQSMNFESSKAKAEVDLTTAKDLISSLMSNITKSNADSSRIDLVAQQQSSAPATSTSNVFTNSDFAKTLSNINVSNLTSIVNSVKELGSTAQKPETTNNSAKLNIDLDQLNKPSSDYDNFNIGPGYPQFSPGSNDRRPYGYDNVPIASDGMPNRDNPVYGGDQAYRDDQFGYDQDRYRYDPGYAGDQRYGAETGYRYNDNAPAPVAYPSYPRDSAPAYGGAGRGNDYYPERGQGYGGDRVPGYGGDRGTEYGYERDARYAAPGPNQQQRPAFADRGRGQFQRPVENNAPNNYYQRGQADARSNPRYNNYDRYY